MISATRLIVCIYLLASFASAQDLSKPRKWTSSAGTQIEASVGGIDLDTGTVKLKSTDGRELNIAISLLVEKDRALLKKWYAAKVAKEKGTGAATEAGPGKLSVYRDGKWKRYNTIYEGPMYDAVLDSGGTLVIYPKGNGERLGKPLQAYLHCGYREKGIARWTRRPIVEFENPPAPSHSTKPIEIELKGKFADGVTFDVRFDCEENRISVEGGIRDPSGIKFPSVVQNRIRMTATHKPTPEDTPEQIKAMVEGYTLAIRSTEGTKTYPYWQPLKNQNNIKDLRIKGPWGAKQMRIETPGIRNRTTKETEYGRFWIYSQSPPYRGYMLFREGTSGIRKGRVVLHLKE